MAVVSLLLSLIAKKVGTILQMIFGWSVTALFGRLEPKREMAVTVALVLSLAWPIFVIGVFFPGVASWALAFAPVHDWVSDRVLRIVWIALAVTAPPLVGILTRFAAPTPRGGFVRALTGGYVLAIAFFASFVVTLVTAPIVKIATLLRGWTDTHVFVQPRAGRYDDAVRKVAEACARAGTLPEIVDAPTRMTLATKLMRTLARATVEPLVADTLKVVRGKDVEAYLYPADLLLRGKATQVAKLRAMLTRAEIDTVAYVVTSDEGREVQDELQRLFALIAEHRVKGYEIGATTGGRLVDVWRELNGRELKFEEWSVLESILRRLERHFVTSSGRPFVIDDAEDGMEEVAKKAHAELRVDFGDPLEA